jgi:hypothetical protein
MNVSWNRLCYLACLVCLFGALGAEWVAKQRAGAAAAMTAQAVSAGKALQPQTEEEVKRLISAADAYSLWGVVLAVLGTVLWILWLWKWRVEGDNQRVFDAIRMLPLGAIILYVLLFLVMV